MDKTKHESSESKEPKKVLKVGDRREDGTVVAEGDPETKEDHTR